MVKTVVYRGVVYKRYAGRLYYNPNGTLLTNGAQSLHRQIWLDAGREIPEGHHIHHIDNDHDNNSLENLDCLPGKDHSSLHIKQRLAGELGETLKVWRASPGGKATLRDNAKKMRANTPFRNLPCEHCGKWLRTRHPTKMFCSSACSEAEHFPLTLPCEICGKAFKAKRNSTKQVRTCSYQCGWALRKRKASV